jgi:hypothetical protein
METKHQVPTQENRKDKAVDDEIEAENDDTGQHANMGEERDSVATSECGRSVSKPQKSDQ